MRGVSLAEATRVWARIGLTSFGGPAGQIALMHRILVDEKRWITERQFLHALNFCMLLPGPEAQQLATYVGWLMHRIRGGLVAGSLFILPGFLVIMALSYVYVTAGDLALVQGLFTGLKAAIVVIVLQAVIRIGRRSMRGAVPAALAVAAFLAMFAWHVPFPVVVISAAVAGALFPHRFVAGHDDEAEGDVDDAPSPGLAYVARCTLVFGLLWLLPTGLILATAGPDDVYADIAVFFSKMAVVTFGGAYAVLAYVSQEAVATFNWLAPGEMMDGLAMAETTPGPVTPASAPYIERLRQNRVLSGALAGVTAAVVGVIVNLALWFTIHAMFGDVSVLEVAGASVELPVAASLRVEMLLITLLAAVAVFRARASLMQTLAITGLAGVWLSLV